MIKDLAWKTFKNTGDINTFLELMKIENTEKEVMISHMYGLITLQILMECWIVSYLMDLS